MRAAALATLLTVVALVGADLAVAEYTESAGTEGATPVLQGADAEWRTELSGTTCVDDFDESGMSVADAELVSAGQDDAYDDAYRIYVDGESYDPDAATAGASSVTGAPQTLAGIEVTTTYKSYPTNDVLRQLTTLTNRGGAPRTITVGWGHDRGSDDNTVEEATSSGDTTVGPDDQWVVSSDNDSFGDPRLGFVTFGDDDPATPNVPTGPEAIPADCTDAQDLGFDYLVTVPAGATCSVLNFGTLTEGPGDGDDDGPPADATTADGGPADDTAVAEEPDAPTTTVAAPATEAADTESIASASAQVAAIAAITGDDALVSDLTQGQRASVVNFDLAASRNCAPATVLDDNVGPIAGAPGFTG